MQKAPDLSGGCLTFCAGVWSGGCGSNFLACDLIFCAEPVVQVVAVFPTKSQIPVIEQAIETAALMLGTDKSRGYCLEMICADFLAGANLDKGNPDALLYSISRFFEFLPAEQRQAFVAHVSEKAA